ncbi:MAG: beta-propeller domain-containing protein [Candidatus Woesearchaeota archaeon]
MNKSITTWLFPIALAFLFVSTACQPPTGIVVDYEQTFRPEMNVQAHSFKNSDEITAFLSSYMHDDGSIAGVDTMLRSEAADMVMESSAPVASDSRDFSETNVQVEGVDEADIIKTDGNYIYTVTQNTLFIIDAYPGEDARVISRTGLNSSAQGMFINGDTLLLFRHHSDRGPGIWRGYYHDTSTFIELYDISDRSNPALIESYEVEGYYTEGRMIGDYAYLIVRSHADISLPTPTPFIRVGDIESRIEPSSIYYYRMPYRNPQYATVHMVNMDSHNLDSKSIVVEGGETIYMSHDNLYIATTQYINEWDIRTDKTVEMIMPRLSSDERNLLSLIDDVDSRILSSWEKEHKRREVMMRHLYGLPANEQDALLDKIESAVKEELSKYEFRDYTLIHKVAVDRNRITLGDTVTVPGRLNNQFAMDEHNGILRVATTSNMMTAHLTPEERRIVWQDQINTENHVLTISDNMDILDHERGIAFGERIFSSRFMGDMLYLVTFRDVDPFFAIDLSNPNDINVLGELKIPGFSRYLHPYDENTIIGIGRDGTDDGRILGLKVSLFDVTDPYNPRETVTYALEGRYSSSVAEWEHKAFLFSKDKNLLVIPARSWDHRAGGESYNGALVFHISRDDIRLRGLIDHGTASGSMGVERSLYIEELLYTKSPNLLRINRISDLETVNRISLDQVTVAGIPIY